MNDLSRVGSRNSISQDEVRPRKEGTCRGIEKWVTQRENCRFRKTGYSAASQFDPKKATGALLRTKGRRLILYR